ncbi:Ig-like domain-containing protein, partial [Streptomyces nojiriensis]|uniref:Ig-like domain-containing protein n=1 Tax=Streptomyces nojiriensis TaxID=66374 RepID=UPI0035D91AA8
MATTDAQIIIRYTVPAATTTALASSPNPSTIGQNVTFTATVTDGAVTPTGTVTFKDGTATIGTGTLNGAGIATYTTSTLTVGSHTITAVYGGDTTHTASTSTPLTQTVQAADTTTTVLSGLNPSIAGQNVTFNATVTAAAASGTPTGTVTFKDGTATIGTGTLNGAG